ncbi:MAG: type II secretion system F family protein [Bacillota bacterium]
MSPTGLLFGLTVFFTIAAIALWFNRNPLQESLSRFNKAPSAKSVSLWDKMMGIGQKGNIKESEVFSFTVAISAAITVLVYLMFTEILIALTAGAATFVVFPRMYARYRIVRLQADFNRNLPRGTSSIVATMLGGATMLQGFKNAGQELPSPVNQEYLRVAEDVENNVPFEDAVQRMAARVGTPESYLLADSVSLIKEVGGGKDAVNLLESAAANVREREFIAEKIRANTSHIVLAFGISTIIPFGLAAFLSFAIPEYRIIMATLNGKIIIVCSAILLAIGWLIVKSIIKSTREQI